MNLRDIDHAHPANHGAPPLGRRGFLGGAVGVTVSGAVLSGFGADSASASAGGGGERGAVRTASGLVSGVPAAVRGVTVYKGIPYAASTAGESRWRPPQAAPSWKGVRAADSWGPACPQPVDGIPPAEVPELSEDCLNLNVWTAAADQDERRPVFVWIYGGRNSAMWSGQPIYDGATLAGKGVVVVTFNHRVGPFGDLAHPELSAESGHHASGNWGVLDSVAALQWVRRNIAAFGGDPDRVTLAGWSHGSSFTNILMISRLARGLFQRALLSSGVQYTKDPSLGHVAGGYSTLAAAEATGSAFASYLGASSVAELRALSAGEIVARTFAPDAPSDATDFGNVLDGYVLPASYTEAMHPGMETDVPVLTGNCRDENGASPTLTMTVADYRSFAAGTFGDRAEQFLALYPASTDAEAAQQYCAYAQRRGARLHLPVGNPVQARRAGPEPGLRLLVDAGPARNRHHQPDHARPGLLGSRRLPRVRSLLHLRRPVRHRPAVDGPGLRRSRHHVLLRRELRGHWQPQLPGTRLTARLARAADQQAGLHGTRRRFRADRCGGQHGEVRLLAGLPGIADDGILTAKRPGREQGSLHLTFSSRHGDMQPVRGESVGEREMGRLVTPQDCHWAR
ncbi:carboxylesterase type B [Streptacidiphilus sp. EB103A]